jgi:hypothetical protein
MFARGSRYRTLTESAIPDRAGEWIRGKDLRLIPAREALLAPPGQRVTHTVLEGDRVDLLALKYYGDTTKWWQIGDVNPDYPFPTDLLGQGPLVEEAFTLAHAGFEMAHAQLVAALGALGAVRTNFASFFRGDEKAGTVVAEAGSFDKSRGDQMVAPRFAEVALVVTYATSTATRQALLAEIAARGYRLLRSFAWEVGTDTNEAFSVEQPAIKGDWRELIRGLSAMPGLLALRPDTADLTLQVAYNGAMLRRESLGQFMAAKGFTVASVTRLSRVGDRILIPPPQVV